MPWKVSDLVDERRAFIDAWLRRDRSTSALCEEFGISRKTGHKWIDRFRQGGIANLVDQSRAPRRRPQALAEATERAIVELRKQHPFWGPKKLRAVLERKFPNETWPAVSTIGEVIRRQGLVVPRKTRRRTPCWTQPLAAATEPNIVWSADFKGHFRVGGVYCHPLTITDNYSRLIIDVRSMDPRHAPVQQAFEEAFATYGLPWRIRTDNGSPFASASIGGLSALSVWWIKLGITPERIERGHPEQNGRHERMHRTLKAEVARPARPSLSEQQTAFDAFRQEFNEERPHEALGQKTPASLYHHSSRALSEPVDPEYPDDFDVRRVRASGTLKWKGNDFGLGCVVGGEVLGIEPVGDGLWSGWFGPVYLGTFEEEGRGRIRFTKAQRVGSAA